VVADRLNKAGLGHFCLKLHRDVKKASVLAEFKQRLEMSATQFEASAYERQREQWQAQRDALKRYSELLNEPVGNLGISVHELLWRATGAHTWAHEIPAQLHTVTVPDARLLQPRHADAARASLAALQTRFEAANQIVHDMADHPWRGARCRGLTPMDVTAATNRAAAWQQALCDMGSLVGEVFGDAIREREFGFLRDLIRRLQAFPEAPRPGWFDDRKEAADRTFRRAVLGFAVRIQRAGEIADELAAAFGPRTAGEMELDELDVIREGANALGIGNSTPEAVAQELSAVRKRAGDWEAVRSGIQRLLGLFGLEDRSGTSVSHALSAAQFVLDADRTLLLARTDALVDESHGQVLKAAAKRFQQQRDDLARRYHLASVPAADKVSDICRISSSGRVPCRIRSRSQRGPANLQGHLQVCSQNQAGRYGRGV
jgi:hypothetical protein